MASFNLPAMNRMRRVRPSPAYDEYAEHIDQAPDEADYSPSILRRIGAALAGGLTGLRDPRAGMEVSQNIVRDPYNRAVAQHERVGKERFNAAKLEREREDMMMDYERDMMTREETARYHDMTNQRFEEDRELRREQAEQRAQEKDVELTMKEHEMEQRRAIADQLAAIRARMAGVAEKNANTSARRAGAYEQFVGKYGTKQPSDNVTPLDQRRVRQMAVVEVMKDPRFSKVVVNPDGSYNAGKLNPDTQQEFEQMIQMYENEIVNKKKSSYTNPFAGNGAIRDEDFEFERRLQDDDDMDWMR